MDIDLKQLKELMRSVKQFGVTELEIEEGGTKIRLVRQNPEDRSGNTGGTNVTIAAPQLAAAPAPGAPAATTPSPTAGAAPAPTEIAEDDPSVHFITSPFVGTFYQSPSPDAAAFVKVGSSISVGDPLCIVEAMKLMNEIESEVAGEILEVLAANGKPVEYGDRLFKVRKA